VDASPERRWTLIFVVGNEKSCRPPQRPQKPEMNKLLKAAKEIAEFLEEKGISYAVIGGIAVQYWGEPRITHDVGITVLIPSEDLKSFIEELLSRFQPRIENAKEFALKHRVILVKSTNGVPVDISLGIPGYEEWALKRAVWASFPEIGKIRLINVEDLVIHKCVAGRPRDVEDITTVLVRQRLQLDFSYIKKWLEAFKEVIESHDPLRIFEKAINEAKKRLETE
jgi:hypothetical protein